MRHTIIIICALASTGCPKDEATPSADTTSVAAPGSSAAEREYAAHLKAVDEHLHEWRPEEAVKSADAAIKASDTPEARQAKQRAERCVEAKGLPTPEETVLALVRMEEGPWRAGAIAKVAATSEVLKAPNTLAPDRSIDLAEAALPGPSGAGRAAPAEQIGLEQALDRAHRLFAGVACAQFPAAKLEVAEKDLAWVEVRGFKGRVNPERERKLAEQIVNVHLARLLALVVLNKKADAQKRLVELREKHPGAAAAVLALVEREVGGA